MRIWLGYLFALLALFVVLAVLRMTALRRRGAGQPDPQSVPIEDLALVAAGPSRVALATLVRLWEAGSITIPRVGRPRVCGPLPRAAPRSPARPTR